MTRFADNLPELTAGRPARRQGWRAPTDHSAHGAWLVRLIRRPKSITLRTDRGALPRSQTREPKRLSRPAGAALPSGQADHDKYP
jgi:hypothetical protein